MACKELKDRANCDIILCVQPSDIQAVAEHVKTFAQHIDGVKSGSRTGHVIAEAVKAAGAKGTLINHSEKRLSFDCIKASLERTRANKITSVCCASDNATLTRIVSMKPDYIAIEPPELIGTGISVSKAKPDIVKKAAGTVRELNPSVGFLCGAGVSNGDDVRAAMDLGAQGVLLASAVAKSKNPKSVIEDLIRGFE